MRFTTLLRLCLVFFSSAALFHVATAAPLHFIRLYTKPGWKGTLVQKNFHLGQCKNWAPAVGIYTRSVATQIPGIKCTIYAKHENCNGNGHTFNSAVYDLQASGYPTFWRSFKCVAAAGAAEDMPQDLHDARNATADLPSHGSAETAPSDSRELSGRTDLVAELSENADDGDDSTSQKWNRCPPSVAGVPLNHCGSSVGVRHIPSTMLTLAMGAGAIAALIWF